MDKTTKTALLAACGVVIAAGSYYLWDKLSFDWRVNRCVEQAIESDFQSFPGIEMQTAICAKQNGR